MRQNHFFHYAFIIAIGNLLFLQITLFKNLKALLFITGDCSNSIIVEVALFWSIILLLFFNKYFALLNVIISFFEMETFSVDEVQFKIIILFQFDIST